MLVSAREMLMKAAQGHYAVGQFNINNLEWIKAILQGAEESSSPVIFGVTGAACEYMGGLRAVRELAEAMAIHMRVTVPVALHLDHSTMDLCLEAIGAGFSSVMFDGSHMPFSENLRICRELAAICAKRGISLEAELGSPAGEEDGVTGSGEKASPAQCAELAAAGITCLAASIGNMHGEYPPNWPGLDLPLLEKIRNAVNGLPLALHGGSGIPDAMIKQSIALGVCKINVNTECQIAFSGAMREYYINGKDAEPKGYNLQKIMASGIAAITVKVREKIAFFGSANKI